MFQVEPIGYFHSSSKEKYSVPSQPAQEIENEGVIVLCSHCHFEQALEGLDGFDRIWIIFRFHRNTHWKPKVLPPRGNKKRGVFATRSPHRPNFIGLSCVELKGIRGLKLFIGSHDLVDGTPILDIKPYLNYADSFTAKRQGWLDDLQEEIKFTIEWSDKALSLAHYLRSRGIDLEEIIHLKLRSHPYPYPNKRIKHKGGNLYELAYKSWRIIYQIDSQTVRLLDIQSGYDQETLQGKKESSWPDIPLHLDFLNYKKLI